MQKKGVITEQYPFIKSDGTKNSIGKTNTNIPYWCPRGHYNTPNQFE